MSFITGLRLGVSRKVPVILTYSHLITDSISNHYVLLPLKRKARSINWYAR